MVSAGAHPYFQQTRISTEGELTVTAQTATKYTAISSVQTLGISFFRSSRRPSSRIAFTLSEDLRQNLGWKTGQRLCLCVGDRARAGSAVLKPTPDSAGRKLLQRNSPYQIASDIHWWHPITDRNHPIDRVGCAIVGNAALFHLPPWFMTSRRPSHWQRYGTGFRLGAAQSK
jgi:hypothetical protein